MTSTDRIIAEIDGLKVYIDGKLSVIDGRLSAIEGRLSAVEGNIADLKTEIRVNAVRIEEVKNAVNWDFTALAIIVAFVGFAITLAPMFREMFSRKEDSKTEEKMRVIVREELAKLNAGG